MEVKMEAQKIQGSVENVIFRNDDTGFAVIDLGVADELVTVVGELFGVAAGEELTVWGEYATHPSFGRQFKASACERVLPSTSAAILKYLSNKAINGVGPAIARRMVDAFGDKTLDVIAKQPELLSGIKGISRAKADEISAEFRKIYGVRETIASLSALGLDTSDALILYRSFSEYSVELIRDNPYLLCGFPLYKEFEFADGLASRFEIAPDDAKRIRAGLVYILRHNLSNGHTCIPTEKLIDTAFGFLDLARDSVEIALYDAVEDNLLRVAKIEGAERVFLNELMRAERYIAERLQLLNSLSYVDAENADEKINEFEKLNDIQYEALQRKAIELSLTTGAVVITGGPGTGKTTTLNAIISLCEHGGDDVLLAAPTGRAAKRLSELTGREAKTIHRLLEVDYQSAETLKFVHDETNPLKGDVVVIDEMSMVDVNLFESLLRGIKPHCRLIMVGDFNQLPSVGAGNILRDIIDSGACETVEFQKIFRQAAKSLIVVNAHCIVDGQVPDIDTKDKDFFFLRTQKEQGAGLICDLVGARLPKAYKFNPFSDIQVLTPSRKGLLGTMNLNDELRARLNPQSKEKAEVRIMGQLFRVGDRIMQIKNNYDIKWEKDSGENGLGVFNGDIGLVSAVDRNTQIIVCLFDDRRVKYTFEQARQLESAYAVTVHKSQGSEFPCVVLGLADFSNKLAYRNLLYTAVTRARSLLVIVGEQAMLERMVENDRKMLRYTGLRAFLSGEA
ncbi:MAG: ATP-dependent RecD-like DNA helicase [Oscillospiraceae bacterium]